MARKEGKGNAVEYFEDLAIYLIFVFFAFLSIVLWIFNWICWRRRCCCFNSFDEYCNKVFSWWLSWVFLCGVLACCIAGFVTANRFGFALYGTRCAYERIYYDIMFGQKKETYPKWEGIDNINQIYQKLSKLNQTLSNKYSLKYLNLGDFYYQLSDIKLNNINEKEDSNLNIFHRLKILFDKLNNITDQISEGQEIININNYIRPFFAHYVNFFISLEFLINNKNNILNRQLKNLNLLINSINDLEQSKSNFIIDFTYYFNVALAMGKIIPIIYFSLLLTFVVASGALLITYFCKKVNQQWWILPMHIAWNGLRFFIFSFFMYGCAYGWLYLHSKDAIAYLKYGAFDKDNINGDNNDVIIIPKSSQSFFKYCLFENPAYEDLKENDTLNEFVKSAVNIKQWINNQGSLPDINEDLKLEFNQFIQSLISIFQDFLSNIKEEIEFFEPVVNKGLNIYDNLNCSFIDNNINLMYRAIWDFAWETRVLCALSCCIGFFGEIAVYSFLWVMHLWSKEDNNYNNKYNSMNNIKKKKKFNISPPKDNEDESNTELANVKNNKYNNDSDSS